MKLVWLWGVASVGLLVGLGVYLLPLQPNLVALQFTFTPAAFHAVLDAWGPQGVALFRSHLPVDGVLLLCYGMFGYQLATRSTVFHGFSAAAQRRLALVMPLAAFFDSVENLLHGYLTGPSTQAAAAVYGAAGVAVSLKFLLLLLFAVCCGWSAFRRPAPSNGRLLR